MAFVDCSVDYVVIISGKPVIYVIKAPVLNSQKKYVNRHELWNHTDLFPDEHITAYFDFLTFMSHKTSCLSPQGVCAINGLLYVIGGDDGSCNLSSVEFYNPATDKWSLIPTNMSNGRSYAGESDRSAGHIFLYERKKYDFMSYLSMDLFLSLRLWFSHSCRSGSDWQAVMTPGLQQQQQLCVGSWFHRDSNWHLKLSGQTEKECLRYGMSSAACWRN